MPEPQPFTHREVDALNQSIRDLTTQIRELRAEMSETYVRKDVIGPQLVEMQHDISRHDDWLTWVQRIVIGAVFLALLSLVIVNGGKP